MDDRRAFGSPNEEEGSSEKKNKKTESSTPNLDQFGRDLTKLARLGKLDPVIGREKEIDKTIQILNKRKKNNVVLLGNPGTGKTAIVEAFANRIAKKKVDRWLFNKRIIEINFTSVVSGTKYRGEFEQRMEEIVKEITENPDIIVFIDELHNIIGAGGASGSMDAANILKPALARGDIKCIGATTFDEYKKIIESDSALERRFQKVVINEPSKEETKEILHQIKSKYENYHNVTYTDEVLDECVSMTGRYITNRNFPDKAIDIMDEVGSRVKLNNSGVPDSIKDMEKELVVIVKQKDDAAKAQNYESAAKFRDEQRAMDELIEEENEKWEKTLSENKIAVTVENVAQVISSHTGIPLNKLTAIENDKLLEMENHLKGKVIGQNEPVEKICEAIHRSRIGIQDPNKPILSALCLGSTGVGKTYLTKVLAKYMFDTDDSFIRFDMSEYMEKFSSSKLIGSPPGYIGHEDKGLLTEKVKNHPYCVLLFDEIEKAHPDVFNLFLQILDDGQLTDSHGTTVDFKNTIIIMTSNIGTSKILSTSSLGFSSPNSKEEDVIELVMGELKKKFPPELINRIDEKIVFQPLKEGDILKIVDLELQFLIERVEEKGYKMSVDKAAKKFLAEKGYSKDYGARPLKRVITSYVENVITKAILHKTIKEGEAIKISYNKKTDLIIIK